MQTRQNKTAVSNEEIIAALLGNGTIKAAAAAAGIAPRTIYDRMKDKAFREEYKTARADIVRQAATSLAAKFAERLTAAERIAEAEQDAWF